MKASGPPRFPLLRTRRFRIGLAGFILLLAFFVSTGFTRTTISRTSGFLAPPPREWPMERLQSLIISGGGAEFARDEYPCSRKLGSPELEWEIRVERSHYDWLVETDGESVTDHFSSHSVFIPLWPLPLLWLLGWMIYLRRAHRREPSIPPNP